MDDYISRQAAIKALCAMRCGCKPEECALTLEEDGTEECADARFLMSIPATDVPERKVGKWIKARGSYYTPGGDPVWECSECGKGTHVWGVEHGTYGADVADGQWVACPNCDAKMEG